MPKELLFSVTAKDLDVQTFRSGGKGGQNQNKRDTGVRITHKASGAVGEARDGRSQAQNKRAAFRRLTKTKEFRTWLRVATARILSGKTPEQRVKEQMRPEHLRVEVKQDGKWTAEDPDDAD